MSVLKVNLQDSVRNKNIQSNFFIC